MIQGSSANLKKLLDEQYSWPSEYMFKFIVICSAVEDVRDLFRECRGEMSDRPSSNGKYISVTFKGMMNSSDEIIAIYEKASLIKGIISL